MIREDTRVHGQVLVKFREGTKRLLGAERTDHCEVEARNGFQAHHFLAASL